MDAWTAILSALAVASGTTCGVLLAAAIGHYLAEATREPSPGWAERVDPGDLLPPPLDARPTGRVAPPREWVPRG